MRSLEAEGIVLFNIEEPQTTRSVVSGPLPYMLVCIVRQHKSTRRTLVRIVYAVRLHNL